VDNDELTGVTQRILAQQRQIDMLTRQLRSISQAALERMSSDERMAPKRWRDMPEDEQAKIWPLLRDWVDWLRRRYALDTKTLPWCWHRHGAATEELTALWTAWQGASAPDADPGMPLAWHDALARTLPRVREWSARTGCTPAEHHDDITPDPGEPVNDLEERQRLDAQPSQHAGG
jgi:hypothetical protein